MKKKFFYTVVLAIFGCFFAQAQTAEEIEGSWMFKEVVATKTANADELNAERATYQYVMFYFSARGEFRSNVSGEMQSGSYTISEDKSTLTLNAEGDEITEVKIIEFTPQGLMFELDGKSVLFSSK